jgi:fermentation-respiration switch protein FrsA (DUF1100 family)
MRRLAATLSGLFLGAAFVSHPAMIERLIFFPDSFVGDPPPGVEERWIRSSDGVRLHAWQATHPRAHASVVWSHGNGGNIADRAAILVALAAQGLDVLAYDYRGYGKSEGRPSEAGVYRDAEAAFDAERDRLGGSAPIVCFGESLGGAVAIRLATRRPCAGVAVVSTFTSLRDAARRHYGVFAALAGARFDSASLVGTLRVPFFAAHGDRDEIVPYELGERLFAAAPSPKRFLRIPGARHNDVFEHGMLVEEVARFVREAAGR